uniref:Uncharacterized protein n=1 Tax=Tarenaya spinosa TaxID=228870 RepID=Q1KUY1_9ROSI|nr:hypothetical protein [Tarenaya spinosa]
MESIHHKKNYEPSNTQIEECIQEQDIVLAQTSSFYQLQTLSYFTR